MTVSDGTLFDTLSQDSKAKVYSGINMSGTFENWRDLNGYSIKNIPYIRWVYVTYGPTGKLMFVSPGGFGD